MFDILSRRLIGKSDSETSKKEKKGRAGGDQGRGQGAVEGPLGQAGRAHSGPLAMAASQSHAASRQVPSEKASI